MKYNISKTTPPAMPNLVRGTEYIALLLSQVSKDMQQSITPMLFPSLGAHISGAEFMYPDLSWKEPCGIKLYKWTHRKFITFSAQTALYTKTQ